MHKFQIFFISVIGVCQLYLSVFIRLKGVVGIGGEDPIGIQQRLFQRRVAACVGGKQQRDLIVRIPVSIGILFLKGNQHVIVFIDGCGYGKSQVFQPLLVDKTSGKPVRHINPQLGKAVNMTIRCGTIGFQFRIFFKIRLQVRHLIQIFAQIQEIPFPSPFIDIADIHGASHQHIRKLIPRYL